jgi:hypothetical protein
MGQPQTCSDAQTHHLVKRFTAPWLEATYSVVIALSRAENIRRHKVSGQMADLGLGLLLATELHSSIQGYSYQGAAMPAPDSDSRWRRYLAVGLLTLARWMAPAAYAERLTPAAPSVPEKPSALQGVWAQGA